MAARVPAAPRTATGNAGLRAIELTGDVEHAVFGLKAGRDYPPARGARVAKTRSSPAARRAASYSGSSRQRTGRLPWCGWRYEASEFRAHLRYMVRHGRLYVVLIPAASRRTSPQHSRTVTSLTGRPMIGGSSRHLPGRPKHARCRSGKSRRTGANDSPSRWNGAERGGRRPQPHPLHGRVLLLRFGLTGAASRWFIRPAPTGPSRAGRREEGGGFPVGNGIAPSRVGPSSPSRQGRLPCALPRRPCRMRRAVPCGWSPGGWGLRRDVRHQTEPDETSSPCAALCPGGNP